MRIMYSRKSQVPNEKQTHRIFIHTVSQCIHSIHSTHAGHSLGEHVGVLLQDVYERLGCGVCAGRRRRSGEQAGRQQGEGVQLGRAGAAPQLLNGQLQRPGGAAHRAAHHQTLNTLPATLNVKYSQRET